WSRRPGPPGARKTHGSVRAGDVMARHVIRAGGLATIAVVGLVCAFLVGAAVPLFRQTVVDVPTRHALPEGGVLLRCGIDSYQQLGWSLSADGMARVFRPDTGAVPQRGKRFGEKRLPSCSPAPSSAVRASQGLDDSRSSAWQAAAEPIALGFADGSVRAGTVGIEARILSTAELPAELHDVPEGEAREWPGGPATKLAGG